MHSAPHAPSTAGQPGAALASAALTDRIQTNSAASARACSTGTVAMAASAQPGWPARHSQATATSVAATASSTTACCPRARAPVRGAGGSASKVCGRMGSACL